MKPRCFGRYALLERIAQGGMGEVFVAVTRSLWGFEKYFAIKKILPALSRDPEFLQRFQDEARLVIPMNHPNVVQVFEVGRVAEEFFICMEFVEGPNLGQLLSRLWRVRHRYRLPVAAALFITRELLAGLEYCYQRTDASGLKLGVVHRDVSPSNVLISYDGAVKLADFGLALSSLKAFKTKPNLILGHLGYIAPEAMDGRRVDHRADIYCAGVLLFELLTCERFVDGRDPSVIRRGLKDRSGVRPSQIRPGVPAEVDALVARAVDLDPAKRFATAGEFQDAVQRALVGLDALYSARKLGEGVMELLFRPEDQRRRLQALARSLDLEEMEAQQPASRTVCIGEAIPLARGSTRRRYGDRAPVLTVINDIFEGDTEPVDMSSRWQAAAQEARLEETQPPLVRPPSRRRRKTHRWSRPHQCRQSDPDLTPPPEADDPDGDPGDVRWLDVETVQ